MLAERKTRMLARASEGVRQRVGGKWRRDPHDGSDKFDGVTSDLCCAGISMEAVHACFHEEMRERGRERDR